MLTQTVRVVCLGPRVPYGLLFALLGVPGLVAAAPGQRGAVIVERRTVLMGTELLARVVASDRADGVAAVEAAFQRVAQADALLSTWREDTELMRLNRVAAGMGMSVSEPLWHLLREARRWRDATEGAFDPAVGALVGLWDLRGVGRRPTEAEVADALQVTGLDCFSFDPMRRAVERRAARCRLDAGGFGKGVGLRWAVQALREHGVSSALLNFGGQVLALGTPPDGDGWRVTVAHPSERDTPVVELVLRDRSASTSAQAVRFVTADGERYGHVLDPRIGRPVPGWGSVTVVHPDPMVADVLSTALLVLGPEAGLAWLEGREEIAALFLVERDGRVVASWNPSMSQYIAERNVRVARDN